MTGKRGGQPVYADVAIETGLALRLVFHQPLRQTEGAMRSIVGLLGVDLPIPDHTTFSRRGGGLTVLPQRVERNEPLHLLIDSTGVKIYGEGEWLDQKHGIRSRRCWRKLHLAVDAGTQAIAAVELTPDDVGDVSALPDLLDQIESPVGSVTADGAYDPSLTPVSILSFHFNQVDMGRLSLALLSWDAIGWCYRNDNLLHGSINRSFVPQIAVFKANRRDRTLYR